MLLALKLPRQHHALCLWPAVLSSSLSDLSQQASLHNSAVRSSLSDPSQQVTSRSLLAVTHQHQQQHQQQPHNATPMAAQLRQYAADAPEPMIVPLQKSSKQQTAPAHLQERAVELGDSNRGPWERVIDKDSGQAYWWNAKTGVTTPVGASKPDAWVAVVDQSTQQQYYWNKQSGETTAVGEPLPGPEGRLVAAAGWQQQQVQRPGAASVLANSLAVGFGVGLVFAIIRIVF